MVDEYHSLNSYFTLSFKIHLILRLIILFVMPMHFIENTKFSFCHNECYLCQLHALIYDLWFFLWLFFIIFGCGNFQKIHSWHKTISHRIYNMNEHFNNSNGFYQISLHFHKWPIENVDSYSQYSSFNSQFSILYTLKS